jgi:hypothetical protein
MKYLLRSVQKLCPPNTRFLRTTALNIIDTATVISYYTYFYLIWLITTTLHRNSDDKTLIVFSHLHLILYR